VEGNAQYFQDMKHHYKIQLQEKNSDIWFQHWYSLEAQQEANNQNETPPPKERK
jgi:hypothetical protein